MFRRELNSPPSTELAISNSVAFGSMVEGTTWPTKTLAWIAPGWSTRNTRGLAGRATVGTATGVGASPSPFQLPRCFSSTGRISSSVVAPVTIRVAPSGRTHCLWKATRSSRVSAAMDSSVPVPLNGIA